MSYCEQQEQEIEALQAIYPEEELEVISNTYPGISLEINLQPSQDENGDTSDLEVKLALKLPENYPDEIPEISLEGLDDDFSNERIEEVVEVLKKEANENIGMVMVFTIVSALQDQLGVLIDEKKKEAAAVAEVEKEKKDAVERKKFEGTLVTPESFRAWKEKFDNERKVLAEKRDKERQAALAGRITGRQLFLQDATLNLSDVALLENAEAVEIDESLFDDEDLDGLNLDDSDEEETA